MSIQLTPDQVKEKYPAIYEVFFASSRQPNEGLHDYFTRKGLACFCPDCRKAKQISLV